ncbi:F-box only protein 43 isoform X2 [Nerophis ophidion]|uniref:F-box only protein 43 isoform X2 n=1 Tax=Nerophis ophidion TaxID=159077 RepID=UPI002AE0114A|nr:F-box only protein 43 isoform X2 [Nerophis ophidion]
MASAGTSLFVCASRSRNTMHCTPESYAYNDSCKGQQHCESSDSGYSGFFHSPQSISGLNPCSAFTLLDFSDTPKENAAVCVTPEERSRELAQCLRKDSVRVQQPTTLSWCETPKVYKRGVSLRQRLPMCNDQSKSGHTIKSPSTAKSSTGSDHWPNVFFESFDTVPVLSNSSQLNLEQELSGRKRRLLFSQVRTSTLEDGTLRLGPCKSLERRISLIEDFSESLCASDELNEDAECLGKFLPASCKENTPSPIGNLTRSLHSSSDVLCTPSSTQGPKYVRYLCEDSGFGSITLDKSQDSSVDHDGSFQELLLSAPKGNAETPNLSDAKRRSRLQRQHRLSTLKEGSSQSDEDLCDRRHQQNQCCRITSKDDDVFIKATPRRVLALKHVNTSSNELASAKQGCATPQIPLRTTVNELDNEPPFHAISVNSEVTPLKTTAANLSLTPALQMVHSLCQQRAQMLAGQSPSLKEQLRITAALVKTPVVCRTTMPLSGLIGRKMGLGKVDILTELWKRNLRHILTVILSHLSAACIYSCDHVCKDWNEIIQKDKRAVLRIEIHRSEVEAAREMGGTVLVADTETRLALNKRSVLKTVQAQSRTSSYSTPQSGNRTLTPLQSSTLSLGSSSKQDKFIEVAKTLFSDECLRHCPCCQHPAKCHTVKGEGVCTKTDCSFRFCMACLCAFHGSKECGSKTTRRRKKDILLPGSAESKRNIRRL